MGEYVRAVCLELERRSVYLQGETIETIYFGGGTPGLVAVEDLKKIIARIYAIYPVAENPEITLEANPDDLLPDYLNALAGSPVNRVSIGVQSFNDSELKFLNRRHDARKAMNAIENCLKAGFDNISIDLMYGLPGQTIDSWKSTLMQAVRSGVRHISAYHLIYEEGTPIYRKLSEGSIVPIEEDLSVKMFELLIDILTSGGFEHYEISNFSIPGFISRHNSSYWKNEKYLGVGASAHSYDGIGRDYNISDTEEYIKRISHGDSVTMTEPADENAAYNDFVITSLRTMWGLSLSKLENDFGEEYKHYCLKHADKYLSKGLLTLKEDVLKLSREGIFISDSIMSDLLKVDD